MSPEGPEALPQAFFLSADPGQRFCLFHAPQGTVLQGRLVYLHPFAEEMNASRRVVAQQCRALAASGFAVLQIDLFGCGDSSGDFVDATWQHWLQDAQLGLDWLLQHTPASAPLWLWGLRAGALLACECAQSLAQSQPELDINLLLWQPMANGQQQLQQFLRLHAAAQWLGRTSPQEPPAQALAEGRPAHVAGYSLAPALAAGLAAAKPHLPNKMGRVVAIEIAPSDTLANSPWLTAQAAQWQTAGWQAHVHAIQAAAFWKVVVENTLPPRLDKATRQAIA